MISGNTSEMNMCFLLTLLIGETVTLSSKNKLHCYAENVNLFYKRVPVPILLCKFCLFVIACFLLSVLLKRCGYDLAHVTSPFAHKGNVGVVLQALGLQDYI